jgi:hypothetical protein
MDDAWRKLICAHPIVKRRFLISDQGAAVYKPPLSLKIGGLEAAAPCYFISCDSACTIETIGQTETPTMIAKKKTSAT